MFSGDVLRGLYFVNIVGVPRFDKEVDGAKEVIRAERSLRDDRNVIAESLLGRSDHRGKVQTAVGFGFRDVENVFKVLFGVIADYLAVFDLFAFLVGRLGLVFGEEAKPA